MKRFAAAALFALALLQARGESDTAASIPRIHQTATNSMVAFSRLAELCDTFGPRLSGSTNLERSIDWVLSKMREDGLSKVRGEKVVVPHWVRGAESLELLEPRSARFQVLGLGGSVATPPEGITAEVLVVKDFAELRRRKSEASGRIVLFNLPFTTYHETVVIRRDGAAEAARAGAVASLIRSVTPHSLYTPHTGMMTYAPSVRRVPHAAITVEDAELLQRMQDRGQKIRVRLRMEAETLAPAASRNVVAELTGRERPEEIVLVGGHIDSWDVGEGAMDDGGGCLIAWESVRLLKQLRLIPKRTLRIVLWTNEENGIAGARAYAADHAAELRKHIAAIESDDGCFKPEAFGFSGTLRGGRVLEEMLRDLPLPMKLERGAGGADISPLAELRVPCLDLLVDRTKYFWYHHTAADTFDKISRQELNECVSVMASLLFLLGESSESL